MKQIVDTKHFGAMWTRSQVSGAVLAQTPDRPVLMVRLGPFTILVGRDKV